MFSKKSTTKNKNATSASPSRGFFQRHAFTIAAASLCLGMVIGTGAFIAHLLRNVATPAPREDGSTGARVDTVNTAVLDALIEKDAARRSEQRRIPGTPRNPFITTGASAIPGDTAPGDTTISAQ